MGPALEDAHHYQHRRLQICRIDESQAVPRAVAGTLQKKRAQRNNLTEYRRDQSVRRRTANRDRLAADGIAESAGVGESGSQGERERSSTLQPDARKDQTGDYCLWRRGDRSRAIPVTEVGPARIEAMAGRGPSDHTAGHPQRL